jgi:O-antigen/teichoic acid export membrane protein
MNSSKKTSIFKNYIYNLIYQVFIILVPLITTPYVSGILEADGIGKYSYSNSIANYFVLIASFGFLTYGQREIAKNKNDNKNQAVVFWELYFARMAMVSIVCTLYFVMIFKGVFGDYTFLMKILVINIVAVGFDISFFFSGNEEFAKLTIRNILIKLIGIICIFVFVKTKKDLSTYVFINCIATIGGNLSLWPYLIKKIGFKKVKLRSIARRIKESFVFFVPTIAITVYTMLDKTLIGILVEGNSFKYETTNGLLKLVEVKQSDLENGYYEQAEKIIKLALTIITSLSTVIYSRNSVEIGEGNYDEIKNNFYFSSHITWMLGVPISLGCFAISSNLVPWFLGEEYTKSILLMKVLSPLPIFIGFANVIGYQYLMATGREKIYTFSVATASIINLLINLLLIPKYMSVGAALGTVVAEFLGPMICFVFIRNEVSILRVLKLSLKPLFAGFIMFGIAFFLSVALAPCLKNTIMIVLVSALVYFGVLYFCNDSLIEIITKSSKRHCG